MKKFGSTKCRSRVYIKGFAFSLSNRQGHLNKMGSEQKESKKDWVIYCCECEARESETKMS